MNTSKKSQSNLSNYHVLGKFLKKSNHPTIITIVGCGGTGSQLLQYLARLNGAIMSMGHNGIYVTVYDDDIVTEANLMRQLFHQSDIGKNKAICMIEKINRFYGYSWNAIPEKYDANITDADILITCVDNYKTRESIFKNTLSQQLYWIDCGNFFDYGQVILSTFAPIKSKTLNNNFLKADFLKAMKSSGKEQESAPSCSLMEALEKQHLFINPMIANIAASMIYEMLNNVIIDYRGVFVNLRTMQMQKIKL